MLRGFAVDMHDDFKPQFKEKPAQSVQESIAEASFCKPARSTPSASARMHRKRRLRQCSRHLLSLSVLALIRRSWRSFLQLDMEFVFAPSAIVTPRLTAGFGQQQGVLVHEGRSCRPAMRVQPDGMPHPRCLW